MNLSKRLVKCTRNLKRISRVRLTRWIVSMIMSCNKKKDRWKPWIQTWILSISLRTPSKSEKKTSKKKARELNSSKGNLTLLRKTASLKWRHKRRKSSKIMRPNSRNWEMELKLLPRKTSQRSRGTSKNRTWDWRTKPCFKNMSCSISKRKLTHSLTKTKNSTSNLHPKSRATSKSLSSNTNKIKRSRCSKLRSTCWNPLSVKLFKISKKKEN